MKEKLPICFKIALVGEPQTGKTQMMKQFVFNRFDPAYQTAFIHFEVKKFTDNQGRVFKVEIWDACGQDQTSIIPYIKTVQVIGIVIDGSRVLETEKLSKWLEQIKKTREAVLICLIVNKTDLIENFGKTYKNALHQQLQAVLKEYVHHPVNTPIFYCSAKTGQGVEEIFYKIASYFAETHLKKPNQRTVQQKILPEPTFKIDETTNHSALSLTLLGDKISALLHKHKFLIAGNGILFLAAIMLLILATFPAGSFIALGLPFSPVIMALIIVGISFIVWNIGYAISQSGWDNHKIALLAQDEDAAFTDFSSLAHGQETTKNISVQTLPVSSQKHQIEEAKPSPFMLK